MKVINKQRKLQNSLNQESENIHNDFLVGKISINEYGKKQPNSKSKPKKIKIPVDKSLGFQFGKESNKENKSLGYKLEEEPTEKSGEYINLDGPGFDVNSLFIKPANATEQPPYNNPDYEEPKQIKSSFPFGDTNVKIPAGEKSVFQYKREFVAKRKKLRERLQEYEQSFIEKAGTNKIIEYMGKNIDNELLKKISKTNKELDKIKNQLFNL
jgi:hypothetical protein